MQSAAVVIGILRVNQHTEQKSINPFINHLQCTASVSHHETRLNNSDPLKPHFYIEKLGFTGVNIIFLISAQNIDCGYSLEPPRRGGSNEYPQSVV